MAGKQVQSLEDLASQPKASPPCVFVLFGATGDLAGRKIAPALYNLARQGLLTERVAVVGVARRPLSDEQFRGRMLEQIARHSRSRPVDQALWSAVSRRWHYQAVHADRPGQYVALADRLKAIDADCGTCANRLFYLAVAPELLGDVVCNLKSSGLSKPVGKEGFVRVVVEKPFGHDLASSGELNRLLLKAFDESQVYRIDHYLGKETVQNMMVFRFGNSIIEPLLNRQYVQQVQLTTAEAVGMEGRRGPYYEKAGALRDMIQSHMLQLLALMAMEAPAGASAQALREEKAKLLRSLVPLTPREVASATVRGQYVAGAGAAGYRQEEGVRGDSHVETYAAVKLFIDNWRWSGVPFYLRTGKRLARKASYITVVFRREPVRMFDDLHCELRGPNRLNVRIYPDEGISLVFDAKVPGTRMLLRPVKMDFRYGSSFESASPEAYEHLLLDAMRGEAALFIHKDEVEACWRFIDSIRASWDNAGKHELADYAPGTWGPDQAEGLFEDPYARWYPL